MLSRLLLFAFFIRILQYLQLLQVRQTVARFAESPCRCQDVSTSVFFKL